MKVTFGSQPSFSLALAVSTISRSTSSSDERTQSRLDHDLATIARVCLNGRKESTIPIHSHRSATIGSTFIALRAGTRQASSEIVISRKAIEA